LMTPNYRESSQATTLGGKATVPINDADYR
jgi:hypothetical protein